TARENRAEKTAGHGHSAIVAPDGSLLCSAGEESDRLLVATLDLARASRRQAEVRRQHPLFPGVWGTGLAVLNGQSTSTFSERKEAPSAQLVSPKESIKVAAGQLACSQRLEENLARMKTMISAARSRGADVIVFPELAVTGAHAADILRADGAVLQA